jgi:hypothetical protein
MAKGLCKTPGPWNVAGKSLEIEDFHGKIIYKWKMNPIWVNYNISPT